MHADMCVAFVSAIDLLKMCNTLFSTVLQCIFCGAIVAVQLLQLFWSMNACTVYTYICTAYSVHIYVQRACQPIYIVTFLGKSNALFVCLFGA